MIVMLISDAVQKERQYLVRFSKDWAGRWTEEYWKILQCASIEELKRAVEEKIRADIVCIDITMRGALELARALRSLAPASYIVLIADAGISPVTYLRPSIGAESLMLKPLSRSQVDEILSEALQVCVRRFLKPDEKKVFVIENRGERSLIEYESICFFEARDKRIYLNTGTREYGFYDTMDQLEERLSDRFIRCHRGFLVNKSKILQVYLSQSRLVLEGEFDIPLSRSYKPAIKEYLTREGWKV